MKVLESTPSPAFTMGKKKHKLRNQKQSTALDADQSESSDDTAAIAGATGQICSHINKSVNLAAMRKAIQKQIFGECTSCAKEAFSGKKRCQPSPSPVDTDPVPASSSTDDLFTEETDPIIWVCLQCGHQGCDRNSQDKHSLRHQETPHSSSHAIVMNTTSWATWCYECDDEVSLEGSKRLKECFEFLRKTAGVSTENPTHSGCRGQSVWYGEGDQLAGGRARTGSGRVPTGQTTALCQKVKGLSNLGNTCFFNAVMQVFCQTICLETLIGERGKKGCLLNIPGRTVDLELDQWNSSPSNSSDEEFKDIDVDKNMCPIEVILPEAGSLTQAVLSFLHEMNNMSGKSGTVTPNVLFGQVCKKAPRFRGYQQQDSHELLRYLLDNMKTEEIKRGRSGILKYFKLSENSNPKKIDNYTRLKLKEYGRQAKLTFVDRVFGGQLISTVVCGECGYVSQIFEPFLDLSLSITEEKPHRPNLGILGKKQSSPDIATSAPKISKHQERLNKKQSRRDSKRKQRTAKNKVVPLGEFQRGTHADSEDSGDVMQSSAEGFITNTQARKEGEMGDNSQESDIEDTSDADVEDNVETDSLRNPSARGAPSPNSDDIPVNTDSHPKTDSVHVHKADISIDQITCVSNQLAALKLDDVTEDSKCDVNGQNIQLVNGIDTSSVCSQSEDPSICKSVLCENKEVFKDQVTVNGELPREKSRDEIKKEARQKSMMTLGSRYQPLPRECSVMSSLHHFTSAELLAGNNKFGCEKCTKKQKEEKGKSEMVYRNASKHYLIFSPPAVLTLHFKRFEQIGYNSRKVNSHVDFPFLLDISPFCSSLCQGRGKDQKRIVYSLYGVVEHSGRLSGGHYTAYVKVRPNLGLLMDFLQTYASHPRELLHQYSQMIVSNGSETREESPDISDVPMPPGRWFHISDNRVSEVQETSVQTAQAYLLFYERIC